MNAQVSKLSRLIGRGNVFSLAVAAVIGLIVATFFTFFLTLNTAADGVEVEVSWGLGTGELNPSYLIRIPTVAIAVTVLVLAIVNVAAYTRTFISMGATRKNIALANIIVVAVMWAIVSIGALLTRLGDPSFSEVIRFGSITDGTWEEAVHGLGQAAVVLVAALLIAALYLRFHWTIPTLLLIIVFVVLPNFAFLLPKLGEWMNAVWLWVGTPWLLIPVTAAAFYVTLRGVEVR